MTGPANVLALVAMAAAEHAIASCDAYIVTGDQASAREAWHTARTHQRTAEYFAVAAALRKTHPNIKH